jgi:hypothetical protein
VFDPSPEATLARKYEAAAERGLFRALKELRASEKAFASAGGPAATVNVPAACEELGSFLPAPAPAPAPVAAAARKVHKSEPVAYNPAWETDLRQISIVRAPAAAVSRVKDDISAALAR